MTKQIVKIKIHDMKLFRINHSDILNPFKFMFMIDDRLDDIINHLKIQKRNILKISNKYMVIHQNDNIKLINDKQNKKPSYIYIEINQNDINFINEKLKENKLKNVHKDKEFEITTIEDTIEL